MPTARKLPSGNWRVRAYTHTDTDGKKHYKSFTAPTKKEAEYMAASYSADVQRYRRGALTVGEAVEEYIKFRSPTLSPATVRSYRYVLKNNIESIKHIRLNVLTREQVQQCINENTLSHAPKTVRNIYNVISPALMKHGIAFDIDLPQKIKPQIIIPTTDELHTLLENTTGELHIAIALGAYAGLRRSEMCGLTHSDIDLTKKIIKVNKAVVINNNNEYVRKTTKTAAGTREIPILDVLYAELKNFDYKGNIITKTPDALSVAFISAEKRLIGKGITLHDTRHYFASVLCRNNVPDIYAMELMGHSSVNMIKTVYQHTMQDKRRELLGDVNSYFNESMPRNESMTQKYDAIL